MMSNSFGFHDTPKDWVGPVIREFKKTTEHTDTVRYQCQLATRVFDWYVPKFLLSEIIIKNKYPDMLKIEIGKSYAPRKTFGFNSKSIPLQVNQGSCEYELDAEKENSYRYRIVYEAHADENRLQTYYLYIPKEEFGAEVRPQVVLIFPPKTVPLVIREPA